MRKFESLINNEKFWGNIKFLLEIEYELSFGDIQYHLNLSQWELVSYLNFLTEIGNGHKVLKKSNQFYFIPADEPIKFSLEFSLLEWIEFQAHFPKISENEGKPYHQEVKEKLSQYEGKFEKNDLFAPLAKLEMVLESYKPSFTNQNDNLKDHVKMIELAILDNQTLIIDQLDTKREVYPFKLIEVENKLYLIAEDVLDSSLGQIELSSIYSIESGVKEDYHQEFSKIQIQDFIDNLKEMIGHELRLVLKVSNLGKEMIETFAVDHTSPCLFQNLDGDYIWAATVNPNDELYEWLCQLGSHAQILDPSHFKIEFIRYCEHKLKKLA